MSQDHFAGRAADLIENHVVASSKLAATDTWCQAAEDCVLARIKSLRILGGLPRHKAPLTPTARTERLKTLLQLWANGCTRAVDEDLFADILNRHGMVRH
ncbi:hypothetical protein FMN63_16890 [Stappia sp. BW2]|uniref:hypothetical protein n=1 Tax=Stappia sp. BW2 TaxID=2592622 RepID=UPI0011DE8951|nr:hypothetical protein [Stappia sp. BW2]TYC67726.1 hypothetical protein FMN63_16890 [Stappia sp. BW2]